MWGMVHATCLACMRHKSQYEITIELHSVPVVAVVGQELIATLGVCIDWYSAHAIM